MIWILNFNPTLSEAGGVGIVYPYNDGGGSSSTLDPNLAASMQKSASTFAKCEVNQKTEFAATVNDFNALLSATNSGNTCSYSAKQFKTDDNRRNLLYDLRQLREEEMYEAFALNQLLFDPGMNPNDPGIQTKLKNDLCSWSNKAASEEYQTAIILGHHPVAESIRTNPSERQKYIDSKLKTENACGVGSKTGISSIMDRASKAALAKFKSQGLPKASDAATLELNRDLTSFQSACSSIIKSLNDNPNVYNMFGPDAALANKMTSPQHQDAAKTLQQAKKDYDEKVKPLIGKMFSSTYGRMLSSSGELQKKLGINLDNDWLNFGNGYRGSVQPSSCSSRSKKPCEPPKIIKENGEGMLIGGCTNIPVSKPIQLSTQEITNAYQRIPTGPRYKLKGIIGELSDTRIPGLRNHHTSVIDQGAFLQRDKAQVWQEIAFELLFHSKDKKVQNLLASNPDYAAVACDALKHEGWWSSPTVRKAYSAAQTSLMVAGVGAGVVAGFFTAGGGWVVAGAIAAGGFTVGAASTGFEYKGKIDQAKNTYVTSIQTQSVAFKELSGSDRSVASTTPSTQKMEDDFNKMSPADQKKTAQLVEDYQKQIAEKNIYYGGKIKDAKAAEKLKAEFLKTTGDAKLDAQKKLAYNAAITLASMGLGAATPKLASWAASAAKGQGWIKTAVGLERFALARPNALINEGDVLDAVGSCMVLEDCSGMGLFMSAGMKKIDGPLAKLLVKFGITKAKGGLNLNYDEIMDLAADGLAKKSGANKSEILKQLKDAVTPEDFLKANGDLNKAWAAKSGGVEPLIENSPTAGKPPAVGKSTTVENVAPIVEKNATPPTHTPTPVSKDKPVVISGTPEGVKFLQQVEKNVPVQIDVGNGIVLTGKKITDRGNSNFILSTEYQGKPAIIRTEKGGGDNNMFGVKAYAGGSAELKAAGFPHAEVLLAPSATGPGSKTIIVEALTPHPDLKNAAELDELITQLSKKASNGTQSQAWTPTEIKAIEDLKKLARSTAQFSSIADFNTNQLMYTEKGWKLFDLSNGNKLATSADSPSVWTQNSVHSELEKIKMPSGKTLAQEIAEEVAAGRKDIQFYSDDNGYMRAGMAYGKNGAMAHETLKGSIGTDGKLSHIVVDESGKIVSNNLTPAQIAGIHEHMNIPEGQKIPDEVLLKICPQLQQKPPVAPPVVEVKKTPVQNPVKSTEPIVQDAPPVIKEEKPKKQVKVSKMSPEKPVEKYEIQRPDPNVVLKFENSHDKLSSSKKGKLNLSDEEMTSLLNLQSVQVDKSRYAVKDGIVYKFNSNDKNPMGANSSKVIWHGYPLNGEDKSAQSNKIDKKLTTALKELLDLGFITKKEYQSLIKLK